MKDQHERIGLGRCGELIAREYLEREGWDILEQNWRVGAQGEVDLVVSRMEDGYVPGERRKVVVFVEVKTRRGYSARNRPEASVTYKKRKQLIRLAHCWQQQFNRGPDGFLREALSIRFDVISVLYWKDQDADVTHYQGAFDGSGVC